MENEDSCVKIKGKWILLLNEHIICSGDNIEEMIKEAEKDHPKSKLVLAKVPKEGNNIY